MGKAKFDYDLIVIGSGAGGSAGAILAARAGLKVALIESDKWGGSTLNYTDTPYSAILHATHLLKEATAAQRFGLSSANLRYNYPTLQNWKSYATRRAGANSKKSYEAAGITCIHGFAHFLSPYEINVGEARLSARHFLLATGSNLSDHGIKGLESVDCLTKETALNSTRPPKTVFVVGAGSTGCEIAQYFSELGSKVLIAEISGRLLPREDEEVGQALDTIFNKSGITVHTQSRVTLLTKDSVSKKVIFLRGGSEKSVRIDEIVLATGYAPATDLGLENTGVHFTKSGITTLSTFQTSVKHIYACGDCIGGDSSAERAAAEARAAITNILHKKAKETVNYTGFARLTNTYPAIAQVGSTEDDCIKRDAKIRKIILPLSASPASNTQDFRDGFIKLISDRSGKLIGGTIMAPHASELISELSLALTHGLTARDLASSPHPAGSWSETLRLAAQSLAR